MMPRMRTRTSLAVLLALLASSVTAGAEESPLFAEQPGTRGFLYRVSPKGKPGKLYLFGTLHVGSTGKTPFSRAVKAALADSGRLALEIDPSDLSAMGKMLALSMYAGGDSLDRHVTPALLDELKQIAPRYGLDVRQLMAMKLWTIPMTLGLLMAKEAGFDASQAAEMYLGAYAKQHAMPLIEIETVDSQIALLSQGTDAEQQVQLADTLKELGSGEGLKKLKEIARLWYASDRPAAEKALLELRQSRKAWERDFAAKLIDERNVKMAARAEQMVGEQPTTFFAVGSMHLIGDKGIVSLLKKRGFDVVELR